LEAELKARWPEAEVTLIPGGKGIFDVAVNGALVFSKYLVSRHAQPGEVVRLLEERGS
jgi:predicted Rdx family selenoprotein